MVFTPSCGHCLSCAEGRPALWEPGAVANGASTLLSDKRQLHCDGVDINQALVHIRDEAQDDPRPEPLCYNV